MFKLICVFLLENHHNIQYKIIKKTKTTKPMISLCCIGISIKINTIEVITLITVFGNRELR